MVHWCTGRVPDVLLRMQNRVECNKLDGPLPASARRVNAPPSASVSSP